LQFAGSVRAVIFANLKEEGLQSLRGLRLYTNKPTNK